MYSGFGAPLEGTKILLEVLVYTLLLTLICGKLIFSTTISHQLFYFLNIPFNPLS